MRSNPASLSLMAAGALAVVLATGCSKNGEGKTDDKAAPAAVRQPSAPAAPAAPAKVRHIMLEVTDDGFVPTPVAVKANEPLMLMITRKTDKTCAKEIVIPEYEIEKQLPLNQMVEVSFTPTKTGELIYGCAMDQMVKGVLTVQ